MAHVCPLQVFIPNLENCDSFIAHNPHSVHSIHTEVLQCLQATIVGLGSFSCPRSVPTRNYLTIYVISMFIEYS